MFAIFHCSKWSHQRLSPRQAVLYITWYTVHSVHWPSTHPPKLDPSSPPHPASGQPRHWARWLRGCEAEEDGGCRPRHKPPGRRTGPSLALTSGQTFYCNKVVTRSSVSRGDPAIVYLDGVKPPSPSTSDPIPIIPDKSQHLRQEEQPTGDQDIENTAEG